MMVKDNQTQLPYMEAWGSAGWAKYIHMKDSTLKISVYMDSKAPQCTYRNKQTWAQETWVTSFRATLPIEMLSHLTSCSGQDTERPGTDHKCPPWWAGTGLGPSQIISSAEATGRRPWPPEMHTMLLFSKGLGPAVDAWLEACWKLLKPFPRPSHWSPLME